MIRNLTLIAILATFALYQEAFSAELSSRESLGTCPAEGSLITEDRSPFSMAVVVPKFKSATINYEKKGIACDYEGVKIKMRVSNNYRFSSCVFDNLQDKTSCKTGACEIYCSLKKHH